MPITGKILGTGIARAPVGAPVVYDIIAPTYNLANLEVLAKETTRWQAEATEFENLSRSGILPIHIVTRAKFGTDVLATVAEFMRIGVCCVVFVQDDYGKLLAVGNYGTKAKDGFIHQQVIEPKHLAGSPGTAQLRGIGTALTAVISRQMVKAGVETLFLHPYDNAAKTFWMNRGFQPCGLGGRMCITGPKNIEKLIDGCILRPEDPSRGEILCCGQPATVRAFSLPRMLHGA